MCFQQLPWHVSPTLTWTLDQYGRSQALGHFVSFRRAGRDGNLIPFLVRIELQEEASLSFRFSLADMRKLEQFIMKVPPDIFVLRVLPGDKIRDSRQVSDSAPCIFTLCTWDPSHINTNHSWWEHWGGKTHSHPTVTKEIFELCIVSYSTYFVFICTDIWTSLAQP